MFIYKVTVPYIQTKGTNNVRPAKRTFFFYRIPSKKQLTEKIRKRWSDSRSECDREMINTLLHDFDWAGHNYDEGSFVTRILELERRVPGKGIVTFDIQRITTEEEEIEMKELPPLPTKKTATEQLIELAKGSWPENNKQRIYIAGRKRGLTKEMIQRVISMYGMHPSHKEVKHNKRSKLPQQRDCSKSVAGFAVQYIDHEYEVKKKKPKNSLKKIISIISRLKDCEEDIVQSVGQREGQLIEQLFKLIQHEGQK